MDVPNVAAADENTGVVDGAGEVLLQNLGLEAALKHVLDLKTEHVIELVLALVKDASAVEAAEESSTLEEALGVLLVEREQLTSGVADLRQSELNAIDLALATQAVLADKLELHVQALLVALEAGGDIGLAVWQR